MSDYTEHLISQAGGDGTAEYVYLQVLKDKRTAPTEIRFSNVDMADVKRAVDMLNGEPPAPVPSALTPEQWRVVTIALKQAFDNEQSVTARIRIKVVLNQLYGKYAGTSTASSDGDFGLDEPAYNVPVGAPVTESGLSYEFTLAELFPDGTYRHNLNYGAYMCTECASLVGDLEVHTAWHNKLLP